MYLVTTGGADHAIFQWRVVPEGYKDDSLVFGMVSDGLYPDSNDEASNSDLSDVNPIDSDIEQVYLQFSLIFSFFNLFLLIYQYG